MRLISFLTLFILGSLWAKSAGLTVGMLAPDFRMADQDSTLCSLTDYRGHWVVVYFYPKDDTPGCTKEACGIRDDYTKFAQAGLTVLGISYDSPESHTTFKTKYALPFTLLSDSDKSVAAAYGAKGVLFADRKTFLIDPAGIVRKIYEKVDVTGHSTEILADHGRLRTGN
ncbi:MAG: peroxiredoxin [Candidatus Neomarinimicrobiota bacterium]